MHQDIEQPPNVLYQELPKWPMLKISGKSVTPEQAKEIILRTDTFMTDLDPHANNREFLRWWQDISQRGLLSNMSDEPNHWKEKYDIEQKLGERLNVIDTNYVHNTWANSSYVGGPYGWCAPDGTIEYSHNVGKWPAAEEVYSDFCKIAETWPFLEMKATLYSGEMSEDNVKPVVSFVISQGKVTAVQGGVGLEDQVSTPDILENFKAMLNGGKREQGLPEAWYLEYADQVHEILLKILSEGDQNDIQFEYQEDLSPEENFIGWYGMDCSERDGYGEANLDQADAQKIFEDQYDVKLDLENFFKKITENS